MSDEEILRKAREENKNLFEEKKAEEKPKKKINWWVIVLILIIAAGIAYYAYTNTHKTETFTPEQACVQQGIDKYNLSNNQVDSRFVELLFDYSIGENANPETFKTLTQIATPNAQNAFGEIIQCLSLLQNKTG